MVNKKFVYIEFCQNRFDPVFFFGRLIDRFRDSVGFDGNNSLNLYHLNRWYSRFLWYFRSQGIFPDFELDDILPLRKK